MTLCKIKGCQEEASGYIEIKVPNTETENYDAISPLRVPVCAGHLAAMREPA